MGLESIPASINFIYPTPLDGQPLIRTLLHKHLNVQSREFDSLHRLEPLSGGLVEVQQRCRRNFSVFQRLEQLGNDVTCPSPCPYATTGKFGNALKFNSTTSLLSNSASTILNFNGNADYSVSAWTKTSSTDYQYLILLCRKVVWFQGMDVIFPGSGAVSVYADGNKFQSANGVYPNDGVWHHIVGVKNGSTGYVYIDGVLKGSGPIGQSTITGTSTELILEHTQVE